MMDNLDRIVDNIPDILRDLMPGSSSGEEMPSFEIMKANIHITKLYLQSVILECCSNVSREPTSPQHPGHTITESETSAYSDEQRESREYICRQLLSIMNFCPVETLESHGTSIVNKTSLFPADPHMKTRPLN